MAAKHWAIKGTLVHAPNYAAIEILPDRVTIISVADGLIAAISDGGEGSDVLLRYGLGPADVQQLKVTLTVTPFHTDVNVYMWHSDYLHTPSLFA